MRYALLGNQIKNLGLANNCIHSDRCYAAVPHRLAMLALCSKYDKTMICNDEDKPCVNARREK